MKNGMRILALVLCLAMIFPAAIAEEVSYKVGDVTNKIIADAFMSGKLVKGELELDMDFNAQALGVSPDEEALLDAIEKTIAQSKLAFGAGLIEDGVRVVLEGEVTDEAGANTVGVDLLADMTLDGVSVESDLLPGKRVSAKWETLLALGGMAQEDIAMIMSLREIDPEAVAVMIEEALTQVGPVLEMAAQLAAPYLQTFVDFAGTLPVEVRENLVEEDYPPTAKEVSVVITANDVGRLINQLCDQLDKDVSLKIMLNSLLAQMEAGVKLEEIIAEARAAAAGMTDTSMPVTLYLGMNEDGVPMYGEAYIVDESTGESMYIGLFCYQDDQDIWIAEAMLSSARGEIPYVTLYMGGNYWQDAQDENVNALGFEMFAVDKGETLMDMLYSMEVNKAADSELPAYDMAMSMGMYVNDGADEIQMVGSGSGRMGLTAAGGEMTTSTSTVDTYVGEVTMSQNAQAEQKIEPTADGGLTGYSKATESMPASGIDSMDVYVAYSSEAIDMAASQALEQFAVESATNDGMNALANELMTAAEDRLMQLMGVLPAELLDIIQEESAQ